MLQPSLCVPYECIQHNYMKIAAAPQLKTAVEILHLS